MRIQWRLALTAIQRADLIASSTATALGVALDEKRRRPE
jgi:hypothetical protein